jgi:hypothetical protein
MSQSADQHGDAPVYIHPLDRAAAGLPLPGAIIKAQALCCGSKRYRYLQGC